MAARKILKTLLTVMLFGMAVLGLSCGGKSKTESELEKCEKECEEFQNSPECRFPQVCLCNCQLRDRKPVFAEEGLRLDEEKRSALVPGVLDSNRLTYSGLTTKAEMTTEKAAEMADSVLIGGRSKTDEVTMQGKGDRGVPPVLRLVALSQAFIRSLLKNEPSPTDESSIIAAINTGGETISGPCGGEGKFNGSIGEAGALKGQIDFSDYCESGTVLSGSVVFTGFGDEDRVTINISTAEIALISEVDSFSIRGNILLSLTGNSSAHFSLDIALRDPNGKTYLFEDYKLALLSESGSTDVEIAGGRFYDPDNGFVDMWTTVPLRINDPDALPSSGEMIVVGEGGGLAISAVSDSVYRVAFKKGQQ